ncbi:nitrogenase cofactor biosynthesis protein NifB [Marinilabilia rubra]|uniref:FeMo cofactor biosynthesis protein NifB n=1 Tax=Marinilabilia rubra TaxID=2162893 RepID=A0A2U2BC10_9BACT|nr:nitrogenase cofactor biosynthesis protein NifB [Marinilabilia rubra]PWE00563.1 nitrogenase cofactor biosynthesis protein NifB [Marinilabilia rubra]
MPDISTHPCFNKDARHKFARVHLPVAMTCNIKCNYCNRKYDCVNESRPGVTSNILTPDQSVFYLTELKKKLPNLSVVGIAGPGDPFAQPEATMETLRKVRENFPEMLLCVSSNGLNIAPFVDELKELNVSHVTITVNGVDPDVTKDIYGWVRFKKRGYFGRDAAELLLSQQKKAIKSLVEAGITTKVNSVVVPGINHHHIKEVAKWASAQGVEVMNPIPMYPVEGTEFENIPEPQPALIKELRNTVNDHLPVMTHCARCRADAAGLLGKDSTEASRLLSDATKFTLTDTNERPFVAVASNEGILVNQHLGEADRLFIFRETPNGYKLVNQRSTPETGKGLDRWRELSKMLSDCRALLAGGIGPKPSEVLSHSGIQIVEMSGLIDQGLDAVYKGKELRTISKAEAFKCGSGCSGNAMGCG